MKTVLVTGPIGSGKSAVCDILRERGLEVYDCDSRTKALYDKVPGLKERIEQELGLPFSEIGIIFSDEAKREKLESIVYPIVMDDIRNWREGIRKGGQCSDRVFVESAVAMEKPLFDGFFDEVWLVDAPYDVRVARNPKAAVRDSLQHFDRSRADRIIINDSSIDNLKEQI